MKLIKISHKKYTNPVKAIDCFVDSGYVKLEHGSLPDVDIDYQSDRRQEIKEYIERRYNHDGKQRVFSAGTFTTLKVKAVIKDVARTMRITPSLVNYLTSVFEDDNATYTDIFKLAASNRKLSKFIHDYPQLFEDIRTLMFQPRSSSVHASALLITPDEIDGEDMECFDFVPIKKIDDILVSENSGYDLDELGLLKNDCLATKELSKLHQTFDLVNEHYNVSLTMEEIVESDLDDKRVYELLRQGYTQNVFQFSSRGMTKFLIEMKPTCIRDLIAANALYRPATIENKATEEYANCKNGLTAPEYMWGTYNALKETYAQMVYQEQMVQIAREVGGLSLGDGVKLVKFISKKKVDKIKAFKDQFIKGAQTHGCPTEDATAIWDMIESGGSYLFNKCISGKERIRRANRKSGGLTIAEMYKTMNDKKWAESHGHKNLRERYRRLGYGKGWSLVHTDGWEDYLLKNDIVDIRYMGIRSVYRITLEGGATIDVTLNHKHPTNHGIKRTDELEIGVDKMYINIGALPEDTSYRFTDKGGGQNDIYYHSNEHLQKYSLNSEKGHCGFIKRDTGYTLLERYRTELMPCQCEMCGASECRLEIHHKDGDHSHVGENLCASCHKKVHYAMGRVKQGEKGLYTKLATVVSIEYIGEDEVYDVEMADPNHTFVTQKGVVTCNSHATAYAVTSYIGAWLKANYPTAFYTVALEWADDKEIVPIMSEMIACSVAKVVPPDINKSAVSFYTDYATNEIFWSLSRIKMLGSKAVSWIINERNKNGEFTSITNFIERIFKYKLKKYEYWDDPDNEEEAIRCPVNARHVLNLILAGCFDKIENALSTVERYAIVKTAANVLGFDIQQKDFPEDLCHKHYFWSQQQIKISGLGAIDYKRIYDASEIKLKINHRASYTDLKEILDPEKDGKRAAICATIADWEEKKFTSKKTGETEVFCKVTLQQNNDISELVIWPEEYRIAREKIMNSKNKFIVCMAMIRYSNFAGKNNLQLHRNVYLEII